MSLLIPHIVSKISKTTATIAYRTSLTILDISRPYMTVAWFIIYSLLNIIRVANTKIQGQTGVPGPAESGNFTTIAEKGFNEGSRESYDQAKRQTIVTRIFFEPKSGLILLNRKPYKEAKVKAPKPEKAAVETSPEKNVEKAGDGTEIQTPIIRKNKVVKVAPRRPTTPTKAAEKAAVATDQPKQEQASPDSKKEKEVDSFLTGQVGEIKLIKDLATNQEGKDAKEEDEKDEKYDSDVKGKKEIRIKKGDKDNRPGSTGKKRPKDNQWKPAMVSDGDILLSQIKEAVVNEESENEDGERRSGEGKVKKKWELTEEQEKQIREMSAQYGVEVEALKNYLETKATNNQFQWIGIKRLDNKVVDVNLELSKLESEYE